MSDDSLHFHTTSVTHCLLTVKLECVLQTDLTTPTTVNIAVVTVGMAAVEVEVAIATVVKRTVVNSEAITEGVTPLLVK